MSDKNPSGEGSKGPSGEKRDDGSTFAASEADASPSPEREQTWTDETDRHWHPYLATPETQGRADEEKRVRRREEDAAPSDDDADEG